jgi:hypothetical protein
LKNQDKLPIEEAILNFQTNKKGRTNCCNARENFNSNFFNNFSLSTSEPVQQTAAVCHQLSEEVNALCKNLSTQTSQILAHQTEQIVKTVLTV